MGEPLLQIMRQKRRLNVSSSALIPKDGGDAHVLALRVDKGEKVA